MSKPIVRITEPSPELMKKIERAKQIIANQEPRYIKCHYCQHNAIAVYQNSNGFVQAKCKRCGRENVYDLVNMRRNRSSSMTIER